MPVDASDESLVQGIREGDRAAERALFARHAGEIASLCLRLLRHRADADEAAQDALARAFERIEQLRDPGDFARWLRSIAINECRRKRRAAWWRRVLRGSDEPSLTLDAMAAPGCDPEVRATLRAVDGVLRGVPEAHRDAWTLCAVEGWSLAETACACGCSLATVKRWIAAVDERLATLRAEATR